MKARLKLKPGLKGTKGLVDVYGDALICVRYRYDAESCTRIKTVEIIVDKRTWTPPQARFADEELVPVRIRFSESALKELAKSAGEKWNPEKRLWFIPFGKIKSSILEKHIVLDASSDNEIAANQPKASNIRNQSGI